MSDSERFERLIGEAAGLEHGAVKVRVLEEAVRAADAMREDEESFYSRMQLSEAATFGGRAELMLTSFSWCLAKYQKDPDVYEGYAWDLLWHFKWATGGISGFPHVSNAEFHRLLEQMKDMYQAHGFGMRPIHYTHFIHSCDCGEFEEAARLMELWPTIPRDDLADCEACEADALVSYHADLDRPEEALRHAQAILNGDQTCAEVPHITYSTLLRSLSQLGRYDEADEFHAKDYRLIRRNSEFLRQVAEHIAYLTHRGNLAKALSLFETHFEWSLGTFELLPKYYFLAAVSHLLQRCGSGSRTLRLPSEFEAHREDGTYDLTQLSQWFETQRNELAGIFDQRNGNDHFSRRILEVVRYAGIDTDG